MYASMSSPNKRGIIGLMEHEKGVNALLWLWGAAKYSGQLTTFVENGGFLTALGLVYQRFVTVLSLDGKSTKQELCILCLQTSPLRSDVPLGVKVRWPSSAVDKEGESAEVSGCCPSKRGGTV